MLCLLVSLGPSIVGHSVGTYLLLFMIYKSSSVRARGHKHIQPWAESEARQAGGLAVFSGLPGQLGFLPAGRPWTTLLPSEPQFTHLQNGESQGYDGCRQDCVS